MLIRSNHWLIAAAGIVVLGLFQLFWLARDSAEVVVDPEALDRARASYLQDSQTPSPQATTPSARTARPRPRPRPRATAEDDFSVPPPRLPTGDSKPLLYAPKVEAGMTEELDARMKAANALYDRSEYLESRRAALDILAEHPTNVRMLRIVVSSSCILGEGDIAQQYFNLLPLFDMRQMTTRCRRYEVDLQ